MICTCHINHDDPTLPHTLDCALIKTREMLVAEQVKPHFDAEARRLEREFWERAALGRRHRPRAERGRAHRRVAQTVRGGEMSGYPKFVKWYDWEQTLQDALDAGEMVLTDLGEYSISVGTLVPSDVADLDALAVGWADSTELGRERRERRRGELEAALGIKRFGEGK